MTKIIDRWTNDRGDEFTIDEFGDLRHVRNGTGRVVQNTTSRVVMCTHNRGVMQGAPTRGGSTPRMLHNTDAIAKLYDRGAPSAPSAAAQQLAAYQQEAEQHPGLRALVREATGEVVAMCLEPVPYYTTKK